MKKRFFILFLISIFTIPAFSQIIKEVKVGTQIWMKENLNMDRFRNGDIIPQAKTFEEWKKAGENQQPAWCYYNNDSKNGLTYGKLYNWYAVNDPRGLAPAGYHIPSDEEWRIFSTYLNEEKGGSDIKSTTGWNDYFGKSNGKDIFGFNALPGGWRSNIDGDFKDIGGIAFWWSSSELDNSAWEISISYNDESAPYTFIMDNNKNQFNAVRCIKD